jgi:hypothetical protein
MQRRDAHAVQAMRPVLVINPRSDDAYVRDHHGGIDATYGQMFGASTKLRYFVALQADQATFDRLDLRPDGQPSDVRPANPERRVCPRLHRPGTRREDSPRDLLTAPLICGLGARRLGGVEVIGAWGPTIFWGFFGIGLVGMVIAAIWADRRNRR